LSGHSWTGPSRPSRVPIEANEGNEKELSDSEAFCHVPSFFVAFFCFCSNPIFGSRLVALDEFWPAQVKVNQEESAIRALIKRKKRYFSDFF